MQTNSISKRPVLRIGQPYTVLSSPGIICRIEEQVHTDTEGKRYIRFHVKPNDGRPGTMPVRRYIDGGQ